MIIRLEKPTLRRKDMDAVLQTMADEQIGPGDHTAAFVTLLQQTMGQSGYVVAIRDRVHALRIALMGMGIGPDCSVGVSALSPGFYRNLIESLGAEMVVFDIDPETGNLSHDTVTGYGADRLSAVILYEPYGSIPPSEPWSEMSIPIIEDITESFGSAYGEQKAGDIGSVVIAAFDESCLVSTAGGAAVMTREPEIAQQLETALEPFYRAIALPGMNAALGTVQLSHLARNLEKRRAIFNSYRYALMKTRHTLFGIQDIDFEINGFGFPVVLDSKPSTVQQFALRYEVATDFAFPETVIADALESFDQFPHAIPVATRAVRFPLYPFLTNQQITQIEKVISHLP